MPALSSPLHDLKSRYDVVVVGSGYGGAIAASRFARAGRKVCVLERGREYLAGDFPGGQLEAAGNVQVDLPARHIGAANHLFDFRVNESIHVLVGSGLGGTSLINANVSLRAEPRVFDDPRWPRAVIDDLPTLVEEGYQRAFEMLRPAPYPTSFPSLKKHEALAQASKDLNGKFYRPPINVNFKDGVNPVGVWQQACTLCGDCVTGCNHTAKNTTAMTYLPDARNFGAEIFTEVPVSHVERSGDGWVVYFQWIGAGRETFGAPELFVHADLVVLGAGSLGSTEILLRSREKGLKVSGRLGHGFSGNGDVLGFAYNCDTQINGIGWGRRLFKGREPVGPCITGIVDLREKKELGDGCVIEEGSIPGTLSRIAPLAFSTAAGVLGIGQRKGLRGWILRKLRALKSLILGPYSGSVRNTLTLLLMSHDDSAGRLHLKDGRVRVDWDHVGLQSVFFKDNAHMKSVSRSLGGTFLQNPLWSNLTDHAVITVHPLGGCGMAEDAEHGVVNHKGQVFAGEAGDAVHPGLLVVDGAIVPRSLGVNPLLTISALAERACKLVARDRGWEIPYNFPQIRPRQEGRPRAGLQFTETMVGHWAAGETEDFQKGATRGKESASTLEFTVTITIDDLTALLKDPEHRAAFVGSVKAPALASDPLTATEGEFRLLSRTPLKAQTLWMHYRMRLATREGKRYFLEGYKQIHDDPGMDLWSDTTTLYITVHEGDSAESPVLGKGILHIPLFKFLKQLWTFKVINEPRFFRRIFTAARFNLFFARSLLWIFGGPMTRRLLSKLRGRSKAGEGT